VKHVYRYLTGIVVIGIIVLSIFLLSRYFWETLVVVGLSPFVYYIGWAARGILFGERP